MSTGTDATSIRPFALKLIYGDREEAEVHTRAENKGR